MDSEKQLVQNSVDKTALYVPLVLSLYICLTNLSSAYFTLPYVAFCLLYALFRPIKYSVSVLLVNLVYLGFSYIDLFAQIGISGYAFMHLCYLAVAGRALIISVAIEKRLSWSMAEMPAALLMLYVVVRQFSMSTREAVYCAGMMLCIWQVLKMCNTPEGKRNLAIQFTTVVVTVFLYNLLHRELNALENGRFAGTGDPNNFALWCNLCLVLINWFWEDLQPKNRNILNCILMVGVFITISVSGTVTMAAIMMTWNFTRNRQSGAFLVGVLCVLLAAMLVIYLIPMDTFAQMDGIVGRLGKIIIQLRSGEVSDATSGRSWLWEYYMDAFSRVSMKERILGNQAIIQRVMAGGYYASHNFYIDFLLDYGLVGIVLLAVNIIHRIVVNFNRKQTGLLMLNLVIVVNIFFRSSEGILAWIPMLM